jgi:hypothetical protein
MDNSPTCIIRSEISSSITASTLELKEVRKDGGEERREDRKPEGQDDGRKSKYTMQTEGRIEEWNEDGAIGNNEGSGYMIE